jgi:P-type Cu+ transporter
METTLKEAVAGMRDPVCGAEIDPLRALFIVDYQGESHPICSEHCRMLFALHPERYVEQRAQ